MADMPAVYTAAAHGNLPPQDGLIEVCDLPGKTAAVVAFPAHFYVLAPVSADWVHAQLPPGDFTAPLGTRFLTALADLIGTGTGSNDAVLAAIAHGRPDGQGPKLHRVQDAGHPRVRRALHLRDDVRVWQTRDGNGCVILGRGVAGRWEVAFEVEPAARGQGLGRALAAAALGFLPAGTPVFAQVTPGNALSLRAVLTAGYTPIGGETLLPAGPG